jgi:hypothetical protein
MVSATSVGWAHATMRRLRSTHGCGLDACHIGRRPPSCPPEPPVPKGRRALRFCAPDARAFHSLCNRLILQASSAWTGNGSLFVRRPGVQGPGRWRAVLPARGALLVADLHLEKSEAPGCRCRPMIRCHADRADHAGPPDRRARGLVSGRQLSRCGGCDRLLPEARAMLLALTGRDAVDVDHRQS